MFTFCDFIQVYVFTTNHHLKVIKLGSDEYRLYRKCLKSLINDNGLLFMVYRQWVLKLSSLLFLIGMYASESCKT